MKRLRSIPPTAAFISLGLISAAAYAAITYLFPLTLASGATRAYDLEQLARGREWAAGVYVVGLLAAFAAFAAAFFVIDRVRRPLPLVLGFSLFFALILIFVYPVTAIDVFYYVLQGREEVLHGLNPLAVPAAEVPLDPLLPFIGEWKNMPSPYGPLWGVFSAAVVRLGFAGAVDGPLVFKLLALAAFGACLLLLLWGVERNAAALLLFAWNPLVLMQGPAHAHNDLLMIVVAALALALWVKRRWWAAAIVVLALAASIKAPALLLAPPLLAAILREQQGWQRRIWIVVASAASGAAIMLVAYLPYWPLSESLSGLLQAFATGRTYTLLSLLRLGLGKLSVPPPYDSLGPRLLGLLVFHACYLVLLWRVWRGRIGLYTASFWAFFLYLLTSTSFRIWYPLWVIPPAVLAHTELRDRILLSRLRWRTYLLSLTSELSILMFTLLWRWALNGTVLPKADWFWMHLLVVPWQFGLPLLAPLLIRRRRTPDSDDHDPL